MSVLTAPLLLAMLQAVAVGSTPAPVAEAAGPVSPPAGLTAEQAIFNERALILASPTHCGTAPEGEIVVCGRRGGDPRQRLPLPNQRAEAGEVVRFAGETDATAAFDTHSCARPGSCEPPRLMETIAKSIDALVHAIRGEEAPVPPYP